MTPEDEAFDELAKRQGGGFMAKRAMAADKLQEPAQEPEREALKLALEALGWTDEWRPQGLRDKAITALKAALAQPAQEPVAWIWKDMRGQDIVSLFEPRFNSIPLYTAPPQRPWVGLTDEEIDYLMEIPEVGFSHRNRYAIYFARAHEAALKEKNT
jgi:hypothetical protein